MFSVESSRRAFLKSAAHQSLVFLSLPAMLGASEQASAAHAVKSRFKTLGAEEAAELEAIAARIIPTDDTPGAREAGVITFIDRAMATFLSQLAADYRAHLAVFQASCRAQHPGTTFASLSSEQQIAFLKTVDRTPFFESTRLLTMLGMFTAPSYGGNRDGIGWKLLGFEANHMFQPPFGYYDRDYPGFTLDAGPTK